VPTVANGARVTCKDGAVWRVCASCGRLAAYAPEVYHCDDCRAEPVPEGVATAPPAPGARHTGGGQVCPARAVDRLAAPDDSQAARSSDAPAREFAAPGADLREPVRQMRDRGRS
jgi:hypothetical protein